MMRVDICSGITEKTNELPQFKSGPEWMELNYPVTGHEAADEISTYVFNRVLLGAFEHDQSANEVTTDIKCYAYSAQFNMHEYAFIRKLIERPDIKWAAKNSLDGLYVAKQYDPSWCRVQFTFYTYLKEADITFWKLKFSDT
jgi:hypothetical protein